MNQSPCYVLTTDELAELLSPLEYSTPKPKIKMFGVANSIRNIRRKRFLVYRNIEHAEKQLKEKKERGKDTAFIFEFLIDIDAIKIIK